MTHTTAHINHFLERGCQLHREAQAEMTYEQCREVTRSFGIKQLTALVVIKRHRSLDPNNDTFILALEHELNDKISELEGSE